MIHGVLLRNGELEDAKVSGRPKQWSTTPEVGKCKKMEDLFNKGVT